MLFWLVHIPPARRRLSDTDQRFTSWFCSPRPTSQRLGHRKYRGPLFVHMVTVVTYYQKKQLFSFRHCHVWWFICPFDFNLGESSQSFPRASAHSNCKFPAMLFTCASRSSRSWVESTASVDTNRSMAMQQEPIDWRYLPYIFGLFVRRNFREYHHNSYGQTYGTNVPPFRILKFPLMKWNHVFPIAATEIRRFHHKRFAIYSHLTHIQHPTENMVE